jgi:hypothetical protein
MLDCLRDFVGEGHRARFTTQAAGAYFHAAELFRREGDLASARRLAAVPLRLMPLSRGFPNRKALHALLSVYAPLLDKAGLSALAWLRRVTRRESGRID